MFSTTARKLRTYSHYAQTVRELPHLPSRELQDLGIGRSKISGTARQAAL